MKKLIIPALLLIPAISGNCQEITKNEPSGKITYIEKAKIELKLEGDAAQFENDLPKEQENGTVLFFNSGCSLYQADESRNEEEIMNQQSGAMKIRIMNGGQGDKIFCDLKEKKKTEQKEFMTRKFLVEGDLIQPEWKITGNFKTILGRNCQEASYKDSTRNVKAWFASSIPVATGPAGFGGLPGLILQVDINDGKLVMTASAIDTSWTDNGILIRPKEGKKVTQEEFKKIVDEKMKEMGVENGQGTNHVIIRYKN